MTMPRTKGDELRHTLRSEETTLGALRGWNDELAHPGLVLQVTQAVNLT